MYRDGVGYTGMDVYGGRLFSIRNLTTLSQEKISPYRGTFYFSLLQKYATIRIYTVKIM